MLRLPTITRKAAALDRSGGLDFVWTTTRLHSGKDNRYVYLLQPAV